uniref:Putative sigma-70 region domain containing protein n=1 Tax=viral metagenome TaxID=1070528 RepID=A0A6M3IQ96_9ZZZZ
MSEIHVQNADAIFRQYEKMIYSLVHKSMRKFGGEFEDLKSDAYEAFMLALKSYDESNGTKIITWIHTRIHYHLLSVQLAKPELKHGASFVELKEIEGHTVPSAGILATVDELSADAKTITSLVLDPPQWMLSLSSKRGSSAIHLGKAIRTFLTEKGWKKNQVRNAFNEIKTALEM